METEKPWQPDIGDVLVTKILEALGIGHMPVSGFRFTYEAGEIAEIDINTYWPLVGGMAGSAKAAGEQIAQAVHRAVGDGMRFNINIERGDFAPVLRDGSVAPEGVAT